MKLDVYDLNRNKVREIEVSDEIFAAEVKPHLLHEVVKAQLRARRSGTAKVKNRADVSFSTRKLYKQKGTGNARRGSRKSPLFAKGGVVFGPQGVIKAYKTNKKVMRGGLISALSQIVLKKQFTVVEGLELETHKTKDFKGVLDRFELKKTVVIDDYEKKSNFHLAARNIRDLKILKTAGVNVFDVLKYQNVLITEAAVRSLENRLSK